VIPGADDQTSQPAENGSTASPRTLRDLQREYPQFAIWREVTGERTRYIARRARPEVNPYTVVTADLGELGTILATSALPPQVPRRADEFAVPNIARMYDYWRGGKDYHAADRRAASQVLAQFPEVARIARANRAFVTRATARAAAHGVAQFLDVGAGLPAWPAVHQVAQQHQPDATVAYVDNDAVVLAHARALLAAGPAVTVAEGDLRDPEAILSHPAVRTVIGFDRPVCLLLAAVLHFLEPAEADHAVGVLTAPLAPGSYLVLSAGTATGTDPALVERLRTAYAGASVVTARTEDEIRGWFTGFDLLPPGLVDARDWRAGRARPGAARTRSAARFLAGTGRKPAPRL